jgi:hypothetical protein
MGHGSHIAGRIMVIKKRVSYCHTLPPSPITYTSLGYTGGFVCSIDRRLPAVSTRRSAYTTDTDAARRQNGVAIPLRASDRCVFYRTWNRDPLPFWELAAAGSDIPEDHRDQGDAQTQHTHSLFQKKLRCGRVARVSLKQQPMGRSCNTSPIDSSGSRDLPPRG